MNLPADVAALLREALTEADTLIGHDNARAYYVLAEAIENLLPPAPQPYACWLCGNAENDCCCL